MARILWQLIGILFLDVESYFLYASFICISQWILWQNVCFWCITWYHGWFSGTDFDNLRLWSQGFFIGQLLAVNFLSIGTIDASLDSSLTFNTRSGDLTGISYKFIRLFFTNGKVDFLYASFIRISQRVLWQSVCFWCIVRYHVRLSCSDFDNLRHWS